MKKTTKECIIYFVLFNILDISMCYLYTQNNSIKNDLGYLTAFAMLVPIVSSILVENEFDFKKICKSRFNLIYLLFFLITMIVINLRIQKISAVLHLILLFGELLGLYILTLKEKNLAGNISLKSFAKWTLLILLLLNIKLSAISLYIKGYIDFYNIGINNIGVVTSFVFIPLKMFYAIGEEYGWRRFLQPRLQEKLGKVGGVLLTGLIWGIYHIYIYIIFNNEDLIYSLAEIVVYCICIGVFLGLCYMKTKSIVLVSILHLMNNFFVFFPPSMFPNRPENFEMSKFYIMSMLVSFIIYMPFLLKKEFRK